MVVVIGLGLFKTLSLLQRDKSQNMTMEGSNHLILEWLTTNNVALSIFPVSISQRPSGVTHNDSMGESNMDFSVHLSVAPVP